jgi:outer membrane murein-binding lipoprotein Lpp
MMLKTLRKLMALLAIAVFVLGLAGCASTPTWNPGDPDALTVAHYGLARSAIETRSKDDAQAALYLLRADVNRMRSNAQSMMAALSRLYGVTNAVEKEDWGAARDRLLELKANYGRP